MPKAICNDCGIELVDKYHCGVFLHPNDGEADKENRVMESGLHKWSEERKRWEPVKS
jgi:hypothetical protein